MKKTNCDSLTLAEYSARRDDGGGLHQDDQMFRINREAPATLISQGVFHLGLLINLIIIHIFLHISHTFPFFCDKMM